jgi:hypothetical protein
MLADREIHKKKLITKRDLLFKDSFSCVIGLPRCLALEYGRKSGNVNGLFTFMIFLYCTDFLGKLILKIVNKSVVRFHCPERKYTAQ